MTLNAHVLTASKNTTRNRLLTPMTMDLNRWTTCTMWLLVLILIGCDTSNETFSTPQAAEQIDFGDPYVIANGAPLPHLDAGALMLTVQYSGGCIKHDFAVRSLVQNDTTKIWLRHNNNGDLCEAYLTDPLKLLVPQAVRNANPVLLLAPDGTPFTLR